MSNVVLMLWGEEESLKRDRHDQICALQISFLLPRRPVMRTLQYPGEKRKKLELREIPEMEKIGRW